MSGIVNILNSGMENMLTFVPLKTRQRKHWWGYQDESGLNGTRGEDF